MRAGNTDAGQKALGVPSRVYKACNYSNSEGRKPEVSDENEAYCMGGWVQLAEESLSEMDRYALAVHRDPMRRVKLSFS